MSSRNRLMLPLTLLFYVAISSAQAPRGPNLEVQREAMQKLAFLAGKWSGEAKGTRGPGAAFKVQQTEEIQYKLDGLVMLIEGAGRDPETKKVMFSALATVSYDDAAKSYRFRAYNNGNYLDTELKVSENGFEWSFPAGPFTVKNAMRLNAEGDWVETTDVSSGDNPPRRTMEMTVRKGK